MKHEESQELRGLSEDAALRTILEGTATETGERFFAALVKSLAGALGTHAAWVTEYFPESRRLRALAFWLGDRHVEWEAAIDGTPCAQVVTERRLVHIPDGVLDLYPGDPDMRGKGVRSYMGVPLQDLDGTILGHLAVLDTRPMAEAPDRLALFRIFADRAGAELRRLRAEKGVREREAKLARLVDSAMDAILELDADLRVTRFNPAAARIFEWEGNRTPPADFSRFLAPESAERLRSLLREVDGRPAGSRSLWIPGGLSAERGGGKPFRAEATLSRYEMHGAPFHLLILRDAEERLEAERRIRSLASEAEYLRGEIRELGGFQGILGESPALRAVLEDVRQVAPTDAGVLLLGETGTGKELVARALHEASGRREKPFVKLDCGAIPKDLIESELFGHEKGAFTGATARREGRFALADGGTIFLDEVGELPLGMQVKLLRVLQEGEFEPVGSSRTAKVDVRVVAATNRDLEAGIREGSFREDLYYRLNVFPIRLPPLRERGEDVGLLARAFADRFARRMGRTLAALTPADLERLRRYDWPGNVRELENVIERAVITARDGRLNLERALPEHASGARGAEQEAGADRVRTAQELKDLERENLRRALERTGGRVSGEKGAARLLGVNPSTLASRMKALGLRSAD